MTIVSNAHDFIPHLLASLGKSSSQTAENAVSAKERVGKKEEIATGNFTMVRRSAIK